MQDSDDDLSSKRGAGGPAAINPSHLSGPTASASASAAAASAAAASDSKVEDKPEGPYKTVVKSQAQLKVFHLLFAAAACCLQAMHFMCVFVV